MADLEFIHPEAVEKATEVCIALQRHKALDRQRTGTIGASDPMRGIAISLGTIGARPGVGGGGKHDSVARYSKGSFGWTGFRPELFELIKAI